MDFFSILLLGLVQGITEWVPVSSKTQVSLVYLQFLKGSPDLVLPILLYVHLGTLLAATIYFRKELADIIKEILAAPYSKKTYSHGRPGFIVSALFFTGLVGFPILYLEKKMLPSLNGAGLYLLMGAGLIFTGFLLLTQKKHHYKKQESVGFVDGIITGLMQGLSTLPGVSRSGTTSTALIWRSFDSESAFNLSFLLSIPTVAVTEVVLNLGDITSNLPLADGIGLAAVSFVFGYLTLDAILRLVKKINLAYLTLILGALIIAVAYFNAG